MEATSGCSFIPGNISFIVVVPSFSSWLSLVVLCCSPEIPLDSRVWHLPTWNRSTWSFFCEGFQWFPPPSGRKEGRILSNVVVISFRAERTPMALRCLHCFYYYFYDCVIVRTYFGGSLSPGCEVGASDADIVAYEGRCSATLQAWNNCPKHQLRP
jgi:hypothetical protein